MNYTTQTRTHSATGHPRFELQPRGQRWNIDLSSRPLCNLDVVTFDAYMPFVVREIEASRSGLTGVFQFRVRVNKPARWNMFAGRWRPPPNQCARYRKAEQGDNEMDGIEPPIGHRVFSRKTYEFENSIGQIPSKVW